MGQRGHHAGALLLPALALAGASCAPRTKDVAFPVEPPPAFSATGTANAPARWWTAFGDPELDRMVEEALRSNLDLVTAWQRLRQARAIVERESAFLFPDLVGEADAEVRRPELGEGESLRLGLSSVYEVDLFGRIRSAVEAEHSRARASHADYRAAALSLSAEVALAWCRLAEARLQRSLLEEQIETNETVQALIEIRFGTGLVRRVDLLRQQQLVEATRAQRIATEARIEVQEHLLSVLLGRAPQEGVEADPGDLPDLPPLPETGLPADLVRRRPDVRRAFDLLRAADRDLAAAISDRYPRLTLSASLSTSDEGAERLFEDWTRSIAAGLVAPLFDAGRRAAEVDRAEALKLQRLFEYGQATLVAFREVEDALARERKETEGIASLEQQLELAERAYEQLRTEYLNGVGDYIDVLTALTEEQELRRELLASRLLRLEFRIELYRALAGGFGTEREASA